MPNYILICNLVEARSLSPSDLNGWSDPFVDVYLDKKKIYRTKYISRTLNPRWNETFRYKYNNKKRGLNEKLSFKIYDHDSIGTHDFLGQYQLDLSELIDGKWIEGWFRLKTEDYKENVRGYIRVKLQFIEDGFDIFREEDKNPNINLDRARRLITEQERTKMTNEMRELSAVHANHVEEQKVNNSDHNNAMISKAKQLSVQTLIDENQAPHYDNNTAMQQNMMYAPNQQVSQNGY